MKVVHNILELIGNTPPKSRKTLMVEVIGIETSEDLINDLQQALDKI